MSKPTGLDWGAISTNYVQAGGKLRPDIWRSAAPGKGQPTERKPRKRKPKPPTGNPPGQQRRLTDEQEAEMQRRYDAGETSPALATAYGFKTPAAVRKIIRRRGGKIRSVSDAMRISAKCNPLTEEQKAAMCAAYADGESAEQLGKIYNIAPITVRRTIAARGGTLRTKSEATKIAMRKLREKK